ncbi:hypothetical protein GCM10007199_32390 [Fictibacillus barbaricus]|nr:hypothetical protein GCM10007199_32390 [Fictibacillus barbaricus]
MKAGNFLVSWIKIIVFLSGILLLPGCIAWFNSTNIKVTQEMDKTITDYILKEYQDVYPTTDRQFEAHKVYGAKEKSGVISVYMYSFYLCFNKETGTEGQSGHSVPVLIKLEEQEGKYVVTYYKEPQNDSNYKYALYKMFPRVYAAKALADTGHVKELEKEVQKKAEVWLNQ